MDANITYIRGTRDRVIDQLGFGRTYPLADLPVQHERPIVGFNNEGKVLIDFTQKDVQYQLVDVRTNKLLKSPVQGTGEQLALTTPRLTEQDYQFGVRATKPRTGLTIMLGETVLIKVGIDNTLPIELITPQVDWNTPVTVRVLRAQLNAKYQLVDKDGNALGPEVVRNTHVKADGSLWLQSYPQKEDTTVHVKATNLKTGLFDNLLQTVTTDIRPNLGAAVVVVEPHIAYNTKATIRITPAQASTNYRVELESVDDDTVNMAVERHKLLGTGSPSADGTLNISTSALEEDTTVRIVAIKKGTNTSGSLNTKVTVLVLPKHTVTVTAIGPELDKGDERMVRLTNTQRGVKYQLFAPGGIPIGWPRFHHKNKGITEGVVDHDFAIGRFDGGALELPTELLKETITFTVRATKVSTGLSADLTTKPQFKQRYLVFDGTDDTVELAPANTLGFTSASFTAEAWIKPSAIDGDRSILGTADTVVDQGLHFILRQGVPYLGFFSNDIAAPAPVVVNQWVHLAWRYELTKGEMAIFVNGKKVVAKTGHRPFLGTGLVRIGSWSEGRYFKGRIADIRLWSYARSEQHIADGMNETLTGNEPGLTAWWRLHEGGATTPDSSTNDHAGTINGAAWKT